MSSLADLEKRLKHIEDERAVERLIASYGPLVDAGEADATAELWALDGSYDVEGWHMRGRDDVAAMVRSDAHQGLIRHGCCHFLGPAVVSVDGDDAVAVCESVCCSAAPTDMSPRGQEPTTFGCGASTAAGRSSGAPPVHSTAARRRGSCCPPA